MYESVHRRLLFLSQTERERLRMERERYKTASGEIATYRMCWQDTAAEINSVKRCGKHPAPAPLHTPLIWDDTQETAERRRPRWRLWLEKKEAATLISWDIGTIIASLPVTFVQCMPYMNRRWSAFYSINVSYTSRCLGCQEGNRKWCVRGSGGVARRLRHLTISSCRRRRGVLVPLDCTDRLSVIKTWK